MDARFLTPGPAYAPDSNPATWVPCGAADGVFYLDAVAARYLRTGDAETPLIREILPPDSPRQGYLRRAMSYLAPCSREWLEAHPTRMGLTHCDLADRLCNLPQYPELLALRAKGTAEERRLRWWFRSDLAPAHRIWECAANWEVAAPEEGIVVCVWRGA